MCDPPGVRGGGVRVPHRRWERMLVRHRLRAAIGRKATAGVRRGATLGVQCATADVFRHEIRRDPGKAAALGSRLHSASSRARAGGGGGVPGSLHGPTGRRSPRSCGNCWCGGSRGGRSFHPRGDSLRSFDFQRDREDLRRHFPLPLLSRDRGGPRRSSNASGSFRDPLLRCAVNARSRRCLCHQQLADMRYRELARHCPMSVRSTAGPRSLDGRRFQRIG